MITHCGRYLVTIPFVGEPNPSKMSSSPTKDPSVLNTI
jgi:hypothetical protein